MLGSVGTLVMVATRKVNLDFFTQDAFDNILAELFGDDPTSLLYYRTLPGMFAFHTKVELAMGIDDVVKRSSIKLQFTSPELQQCGWVVADLDHASRAYAHDNVTGVLKMPKLALALFEDNGEGQPAVVNFRGLTGDRFFGDCGVNFEDINIRKCSESALTHPFDFNRCTSAEWWNPEADPVEGCEWIIRTIWTRRERL